MVTVSSRFILVSNKQGGTINDLISAKTKKFVNGNHILTNEAINVLLVKYTRMINVTLM